MSFDHPLPQAREAERAVLGAILIRPVAMLDVAPLLTATDFDHAAHRVLFGAMQRFADTNRDVDLLVLKDELRRLGKIDDAGGEAYISSLTDVVPDVANVVRYARLVAEKSKLRRLVVEGSAIMQRASEGAESSAKIAGEGIQTLADVAVGRDSGPVPIADIARRAQARLEERMTRGVWVTGIATGHHKLDAITLGLQRGVESMIGARPGGGKTAFSIAITRTALSRGLRVMFVEIDMSEAQFGDRFLAAEAGVDSFKIRNGKGLTAGDCQELAGAQVALRKYDDRLVLDYRTREIAQISAYGRRLARQAGLDLIVVDHIGHVRGGKGEKRYLEIGDVSSRLIDLARETNAAVLSLVQLNREAEHRPPTLSDLRESGNLEQDARLVIFLDRPFFRGQEGVPECQVNVLVPKNEGETPTFRRDGTPEITAHFDLRLQRVTEEREGICRHCGVAEQFEQQVLS